MNEIKVEVPDGKRGDWEVDTFTVDEEQSKMFNMRELFQGTRREIKPGIYKRLTYKNHVVASNTQAEIKDIWEPIYQAKKRGGHILINGLGLGMILIPILESEKVKKITVIELSQDVLNLVAPTYQDERIEFIMANALTFQSDGMRFTTVWHDIWNDICSDNLPDMHILHRKYGRRCDWQASWARYRCERQRREDKRYEEEGKILRAIGGSLAEKL